MTWDKTDDDVLVKEYDVFVDGVYNGSSSVNAYDITGLDPNTTYAIDVMAKDFAGRIGPSANLSTSTRFLPAYLRI